MLKNLVIECKSKEEELEVLKVLEKHNNKWADKSKATERSYFGAYKDYVLIVCDDTEIAYGESRYYKNGTSNKIAKNVKKLTANEFLAEYGEKQCIVIYRKGKEIIALDKSTGKRGVAKCCPEDTYDFYTGAKLAFERLQEPEKEPEFKPYMYVQFNDYCENYGVLGEKTPIKDAIGRELRVGDTVELFNERLESKGEKAIVKDEIYNYFVMGIAGDCKEDGTIENGWKIIKKRNYEDVENGEIVDIIKYVKEVEHE